MEKRSKRTASIQNDTTTDDTADQATTAALAAQQVAFQIIVDEHLKAFQACMQACMEANNKRFDDYFNKTISIMHALQHVQIIVYIYLALLRIEPSFTKNGSYEI